MNSKRTEQLTAFNRLLDIIDDLREKCPWDRKQTFESLRPLTIEEVFELSDAILNKNYDEIRNELGDLFLHLFFYAKLGTENKTFDITSILNTICEKLIYRHPHIYGNTKAESIDAVLANWEQLKLKEKEKNTDTSVLAGVPRSLPSIIKAYRIQQKVKGVGFEFENIAQIEEKLHEELKELKEAQSLDEQKKELGDVLFSLINYARYQKIDPDEALELTNQKFINRFKILEKLVPDTGLKLGNIPIDLLNELWEKAKKIEK